MQNEYSQTVSKQCKLRKGSLKSRHDVLLLHFRIDAACSGGLLMLPSASGRLQMQLLGPSVGRCCKSVQITVGDRRKKLGVSGKSLWDHELAWLGFLGSQGLLGGSCLSHPAPGRRGSAGEPLHFFWPDERALMGPAGGSPAEQLPADSHSTRSGRG